MKSKNYKSDNELLSLFKSNPELGMEAIFREYYPYVSTVVYRILDDSGSAEDIAQEVFLTIWKKRDSFEIKSSLKAYLGRAARNKALNHIRDNRVKTDGSEELPDVPDFGSRPQHDMEGVELRKRVKQLIDMLPERCRYVFVLSRFENLTYKEIAAQMGIAEKTVENQISKALKFMKQGLAEYLKK